MNWCRIRPEDEKFIFDNGVVLHSSQCKPSFGPWHSAIIEFAHSLHSMDIDLSAFACLVALTLITGKPSLDRYYSRQIPKVIVGTVANLIRLLFPERHGLRDPQKVELLQMKIISSLRDHVTYNPEAQRKPHYFSRLLSKLPELRSLSIQGLQRIFYLKVEDLAPAPPLLEAIFSSSLPF
jgi:nuclear receptor subfamily 4 group A protein 2